ncbi:protein SDA1 homolog isoform X2 [Centruroides sculpturatus]|nr:protein SDA1 homolog isoform X2 [Centruroides sculpturatus]
MVTSRAETESGAASEAARRSPDEEESEEKMEEEGAGKMAAPLKSSLKRSGAERNYKCVTFSSTAIVYADDAPLGREEPVKGTETLFAFDPPLEYRDSEEEFDDGDWDCDWFPVVSVNRRTTDDEDDDDDDDDWDVLQPRDDDREEEADEEEDEEEEEEADSDDSRDTIVLTRTVQQEEIRCERDASEDDGRAPLPTRRAEPDRDSDVSVQEDAEEPEENREEEEETIARSREEREPEEPRSRTSDIRRRMEESSYCRTTLEATEVKRRATSGRPGRRASSTECLSEKLRWLVRPETLWDGEVTVPGDVREWKIETSRSDELERFVEQYLGRIERIRKRYSLTDPGLERNPSVRGIRPRFGSTFEILRRLQSQIRPPASVEGHPTWPPRAADRRAEADGREGPEEERGVPEGASSSPPASSESFGDRGFIYYSLNV